MAKKSNKGFDYEEKINQILIKKKLIPKDSKITGGADKADVSLIYKNNKILIELKNKDKSADYGQKELLWTVERKWHWSEKKEEDRITDLYNKLRIIENHIPKGFVPRKYSKVKKKEDKIKSIYEDIKPEDYEYDKNKIEKRDIEIPLDTLFTYYEIKNRFYIQVENFGFYHLKKDKFNIGTKQFDGKISLRLRAKYRGSRRNILIKPWDYGLLAKIGINKMPTESELDIEEKNGRKFPFI